MAPAGAWTAVHALATHMHGNCQHGQDTSLADKRGQENGKCCHTPFARQTALAGNISPN